MRPIVYMGMFLLSECASVPQGIGPETIKTWIIAPSGLTHNTTSIKESKSFSDAQLYRCYSPEDDLTWRNRMSILEIQSSGP